MEHISEHPPRPVKFIVMHQRWESISFLHWRYSPESIRPLLPPPLELDIFDGAAWVGLTPFVVAGLRPPGLPPLPWVSRFPEINVRTYVRGPDGERGIWFFTLEADRLAAVAGARLSYGLPYRWASMKVCEHPDRMEYSSVRHFGPGRAEIVVEPGSPIEPNDLERFLTARFRLYTRPGGRLAFAQVEHAPWPLQSATALRVEQNLIQCSALPKAVGAPLAHFSPGVDTRIGRPVRMT